MSKRLYRKLSILVKVSPTYGADPTPTGAANGVQMKNVTFTPIEGEEISRDLLLPYLGNQGVDLVGTYGKLEGEIEIAGAGVAGSVPAWGVVARLCGLAETVTVGTSVVYSPVSDGFENGAVYFNHDGVKHVLLGVRGNLSADFSVKKHPIFKVTLMGLLGTITDAALPATTLTAFKKPVPVSKTNTTLTIHGVASPGESFAFDLGQKVEPRFLIGDESIEVTDRSGTATAVVEAAPLATVNWFTKAVARTRDALALVHGTVAGNIVQIDAPAVEIGKPSQGQSQGILTYSLPLALCPVTGNDELTITVK